jgi:hypothetical protein
LVVAKQEVKLNIMELELVGGSARQGWVGEVLGLIEVAGPVTIFCEELPGRLGTNELMHEESFLRKTFGLLQPQQ